MEQAKSATISRCHVISHSRNTKTFAIHFFWCVRDSGSVRARLGLIIIITIIWTHAWLWTTAQIPMRVMLAPSSTTNGSIVATKRSRKKIFYIFGRFIFRDQYALVCERGFPPSSSSIATTHREPFFFLYSLAISQCGSVFLHELELEHVNGT